jgi:hypothetical protein
LGHAAVPARAYFISILAGIEGDLDGMLYAMQFMAAASIHKSSGVFRATFRATGEGGFILTAPKTRPGQDELVAIMRGAPGQNEWIWGTKYEDWDVGGLTHEGRINT